MHTYTQVVAKNMSDMVSTAPESMAALHIPAHQLHEWKDALEAFNFKYIRMPVTVGTAVPTGWHPAFKHMPLPNGETFYLFRTKLALSPSANMQAIRAFDSNAVWRKFWCSNVSIPKGVYNKGKTENKKRPDNTARGAAEQIYEEKGDTTYNFGVTTSARARTNAWRREQISQGVLQTILSSVGRVLSSQVLLTLSSF